MTRARTLRLIVSGEPVMTIHLATFGGLSAADDRGKMDWLLARRARTALFVHLAVEREVSREALLATFWPESSPENARHALRQGLYQLRQSLGEEWVESRTHEIRVTERVRTDLGAFEDALDRGDPESAARTYRGPFLDGIHLVDLPAWERWVDGWRARCARAFRQACRDWMELEYAPGASGRIVEVGELWVAADPLDDEAQHRLIQALADAGEQTEAIRQFEAYQRTLEAEGLWPLDETLSLVKRLESSPRSLPALERAPDAMAAERSSPDAPPASDTGGSPTGGRSSGEGIRTASLLGGAGILAALAVVALTWVSGGEAPGPPAAGSSDALAVLPFTVRGGEEVDHLGHGMVTLLGTALDGAERVRPIDPRVIFAAHDGQGGEAPGPETALRLAAGLGATMFVLGDILEAGGSLRIEAAIYDAATHDGAISDAAIHDADGRPRARSQASVEGEAGDLFALVDRLAARLLAGLGDPSADRLLRTASVTTASLPAFHAYLRGDRLMRDGHFERAEGAFAEATALDSTFALAHFRLALAREWAPLPGVDEAAATAGRHAERLLPRDRELLEAYAAWRGGGGLEGERRYRSLLARHPDDLEAWIQLGEILFHFGPMFGRPIHQSEEAWRTVLAHEPRNLFALLHLARIEAVRGDTPALDSLLAPFSAEDRRADRRLAEVEIHRAVAAADTVSMRRLAREMRGWEGPALWRLGAWLAAFSPDPEFTALAIAELAAADLPPELRADMHWFRAVLALSAGRLAAWNEALDEAVRIEALADGPARRPGFAEVTRWHAAILPLPYADSTLARMRTEVEAAELSTREGPQPFVNGFGLGGAIELEPLQQYTIGLLSLRMNDRSGAGEAARRLADLAVRRGSGPFVRNLDRGLRAHLLRHEGRLDEALDLIKALETEASQGDLAVIPFLTLGNERILRAELLAELGREPEALEWLASTGPGFVADVPLGPVSDLLQAGILEAMGEAEAAARVHERVGATWDGGDSGFRSALEATIAPLRALTPPAASP